MRIVDLKRSADTGEVVDATVIEGWSDIIDEQTDWLQVHRASATGIDTWVPDWAHAPVVSQVAFTIVSDVTGDGIPEAAVVSADASVDASPEGFSVRIVDCRQRATLVTAHFDGDNVWPACAACGDLDGDGLTDLVVTRDKAGVRGKGIVAISGRDLHVLWTATCPADTWFGTGPSAAPDCNADGVLDVAMVDTRVAGDRSIGSRVRVLSGKSGHDVLVVPLGDDAACPTGPQGLAWRVEDGPLTEGSLACVDLNGRRVVTCRLALPAQQADGTPVIDLQRTILPAGVGSGSGIMPLSGRDRQAVIGGSFLSAMGGGSALQLCDLATGVCRPIGKPRDACWPDLLGEQHVASGDAFVFLGHYSGVEWSGRSSYYVTAEPPSSLVQRAQAASKDAAR